MEKPMSAEDFKRIEKLMSERDHVQLWPAIERELLYRKLADEVPQLLADLKFWRKRWAHVVFVNHKDAGEQHIVSPWETCSADACQEARAILEDQS